MKELMESWQGTTFPEMIRTLPEVDVPISGIRGWLLQGDTSQAVFLDIEPGVEVPPHSHCAQWGVVVAGEMDLTIGAETRTYRAGDWYYIPEGVLHSARFAARVNAIDVFAAPDRYHARRYHESRAREEEAG
jgi:mannose-6-phosphate isomerase-like protein (cupin superfamily)